AFSNSRWEARLYEQAHYDSLTGLPNRVLLADRLGQALKGAERNQKAVALVFVDLDEFKFVNDSLGHAAGDQLLKICATRLTDSVRTEDTVVRFGGDEFVIVVPDIDGSEADVIAEVDTVVSKVLESLQHSTTIEGVEIQSRASLGIALYPDDGSSSEELTARADAAMYDAKASGRNCYRFYKPEMNAAAMRRLGFREEVRRAIKNDEFRLYYQPKHDCASDELVGAEALIRWQHPKHGFVPPIEFIELAEQMGCITEIGAWVLKKACEDIVSWRAQGLSTVKISVNLSPRQFQGSDVVSLVSEQLHAYCLEASSLEFEVTETALMDNAGESINILRRLRELGVGLSIDDFGTGYSSLGYLKDLPVDVLKIDRSFVVTMLEDARVEAIVSSIISLAHNLGLTVVAEGVETPEEKAKLLELGCDLCQGYLYNPPLKCAEFTELLAFSSGRAAPAQDYQL
ncbi:MAG: putative bifunctional diguanylate cyclase/phosphodiesterase, partial [Congregibacter sp.]